MIIIPASGTLQGKAGTATAITVTISSDSVSSGVNTYQNTQPSQLGTGATTLLTAGSSATVLISDIHLANTTSSAVTGVILYIGGSAAANQIISLNIPANGEAIYTNDGWKIFDANGNLQTATTSTSSGAISGWIDVTQQSTPVLTTNSAATNVSNMNTILSNAKNGATIYIPGGIYLFNAALTMPQKMFTFQGQGSNRAGSPATAFTELQMSANLAGNFIAVASPNASLNYWYTTFNNIAFTAGVAQTAGAMIASQSNVGINVINCSFQGTSSSLTLFNCIDFTAAAAGGEGGNETIVYGCNMSQYTGNGIIVNSPASSLSVANCVIQGQYGTSTQAAVSGITGSNVGALQIINCDILGSVNNLLLNPNNSASPVQVVASVFVTNVYFDNAFGSCIKITGTGATVRCRFDTCSFTTSNASTAFSAVEMSSTFAYAVGGSGIDFVNCNVLNTFGTTGTTNGFIISGMADFSIVDCRVAGWTNGIQVTPIATAGRTTVQILGNTIGSTGGYGVNTVGILLNAGSAAYGAISVMDNNLLNNTTAFTNSATVTTTANNNIYTMNNLGYNPKSSVAQPAVPATTVAVWNSTGVNCMVYIKDATPANLTAITIGGVAITTAAVSATAVQGFLVAANQQIAMTFTTAPTWTWIGS